MFNSNEMIIVLEDGLACFAAGLLWPVILVFCKLNPPPNLPFGNLPFICLFAYFIR